MTLEKSKDSTRFSFNNERGMALVICLMIMVVAAMIAIGVATDSTTSSRIALNQRLITRDFFIADGTNQIEVPKIATDPSLGVRNITTSGEPRDEDGDGIDDHDQVDQTITDITNDPPKYRAKIRYHFYRPTRKAGYSLNLFNSYYYSTLTRAIRKGLKRSSVKTVENKIGPKL